MQHCYVKEDKLWNAISNSYINHPAVLVDTEADGIIKYGEAKELAPYLAEYQKVPGLTGVMLIELGNLSAEEQAYLINRMMNYSASGFVRKFTEKMYSPSARKWLQSEMQRFSSLS